MKPLSLVIYVSAALAAALVVVYGQTKAPAPPAVDVAQAGAPMVAVVLPELTGNAAAGAVVYASLCSACHGVNGAGVEGVGPPLIHKIYEPSHHGDLAFLEAAQNGARAHHWSFGDMPPVAGVTRADVLSIIAFVRQVQAANGI